MIEWFRKYQNSIKNYWYIPAMILAGLLLMMRPLKPEVAEVSSSVEMEEQEYLADLENRVVEMLRHVEGAGECRVTILLSSNGAYEYVREDGNVLVVRDEKGNESPVLLREGAPEIAGVTVASSGAGSAKVQNDIIKAVSTLLGIGSNKICVVSRVSGE